ncbi:MAG: folylpolyglutamate synthase/dihydrofolate synthase family protein [Wenzhouxiangellaceae bacterium]|nr:folylpolyglutamate synthase/dihydrofolate synthase family protein [Wenzhouxiangellaceae bacterium]
MPSEETLPNSLEGMLDLLERRSPESRIELGLERVRKVWASMGADLGSIRIAIVGGTNGKGSTIAFMESIAIAAGYRCMAYSSPHIVDFSERFRLDGQPAGRSAIAVALRAVERARGDQQLTWFEHVTLAALALAAGERVDWLLLEVGLGGRLDAVNIVEPDVAVITSIGLDHQQWLGRTRSAIAREKCAIARAGRPLVVAEKRLPPGMREHLVETRADVRLAGRDFDWRWSRGGLGIRHGQRRIFGLEPGLAGRHQGGNAAAAIAAALALDPGIDTQTLSNGIGRAHLTGRFEKIASSPDVIVDVAHNPAAARVLRQQLQRITGRKIAVFSALQDKNVEGIVQALAGVIDHWYVAGLEAPRGLSGPGLVKRMRTAGVGGRLEALKSVAEALARARTGCGPQDCVIVFGSFMTVAAAVEVITKEKS